MFMTYALIKKRNQRRKTDALKGKHILITGGSSGIGLSFANEVLKHGANVTIFARDREKLKHAEEQLLRTVAAESSCEIAKVQTFSVDITHGRKLISNVVKESEIAFGPVYMLVNCAGYSIGVQFEDLEEEAMKTMMEVNYLGPFFLTQEVVCSMKRHNQSGYIVFVSSQAGLFGLFGYTGYAASKGAVIKFAEALQMEIKPLNISVTVSLPPETDTPGYAEQNKDNPPETTLISQSAGLFQPDVVARTLLKDTLAGQFYSSNGLEGFMLKVLCTGMSPITNLMTLFQEILCLGLFRLIAFFYLFHFSSIVRNEYKKKKKMQK